MGKLQAIQKAEKALREFNREDLAWAAGFFDGEGYIGRGSGRHYLQLIIGQKPQYFGSEAYSDVLEKYLNIVGVGKIYGPYTNKRGHSDLRLCIALFENVQYVMCLMWPWLSSTKKQCYKEAMLDLRKMLHG